MRESIKVLQECIDVQTKKSNDYQNDTSTVKQADYYPNGCLTIHDIMHAKMLRMKSVMEAMQNDPNYSPNYESLEDSAKDLINYASFFVSWLRHEIPGQQPLADIFNRVNKEPVYEPIRPRATINYEALNAMLGQNTYKFENGEDYVEPDGC